MNYDNQSKSLQFEVKQWIGDTFTDFPLLHPIESTVNLNIVNTYQVNITDCIQRGQGKTSFNVLLAITDESSIKSYAKNDVKKMTDQLVSTVESALKPKSNSAIPKLEPADIEKSGREGGINILCNSCGGAVHVTCPSCHGSLSVRCPRLCNAGKSRCSACSGSGQVKETCFACGGRGGTQTVAATWDHQINNPNNTWDYQKRQAATGGQWVQCSSCYGRGGSTKTCTAYGCSYGQVTCSTCNGKGTVDCSRCARTGKVICDKCIAGYNHISYQPKVSITQKTQYIPDDLQSKQMHRICFANTANLDALANIDGDCTYSQSASTITRSQAYKIPVYLYEISSDKISDRTLVRHNSPDSHGKTLDWGEIGDDLLKDANKSRVVSKGNEPMTGNLESCLRTPLHCYGVVSMAKAIGFTTIFPWYKPKPATLNSQFIYKTQNFVSEQFVRNLISDAARQIRHILLTSHIAALMMASFLLLAVWAQNKYRFIDISSQTLLNVAHYGITALLFIGSGIFIWRLVKTKKNAQNFKVSDNDITAALVMKCPAHWMAVVCYFLLLWLSHGLIGG